MNIRKKLQLLKKKLIDKKNLISKKLKKRNSNLTLLLNTLFYFSYGIFLGIYMLYLNNKNNLPLTRNIISTAIAIIINLLTSPLLVALTIYSNLGFFSYFIPLITNLVIAYIYRESILPKLTS